MEEQKKGVGVTFANPQDLAETISDILQWKPGRIFEKDYDGEKRLYVFSHWEAKGGEFTVWAHEVRSIISEKGNVFPMGRLIEVSMAMLLGTSPLAIHLTEEKAEELFHASVADSILREAKERKAVKKRFANPKLKTIVQILTDKNDWEDGDDDN